MHPHEQLRGGLLVSARLQHPRDPALPPFRCLFCSWAPRAIASHWRGSNARLPQSGRDPWLFMFTMKAQCTDESMTHPLRQAHWEWEESGPDPSLPLASKRAHDRALAVQAWAVRPACSRRGKRYPRGKEAHRKVSAAAKTTKLLQQRKRAYAKEQARNPTEDGRLTHSVDAGETHRVSAQEQARRHHARTVAGGSAGAAKTLASKSDSEQAVWSVRRRNKAVGARACVS